MRRLGAAFLLGAALSGCLLGPSADTSPEAGAEVYRAHPAAFDSLRVMVLEDAIGQRALQIRADRIASDSLSHRGPVVPERDGPRLGIEPNRLQRYLDLLTETEARGITAWRRRDSTYHVEVSVAASGIAVSGCTLHLVSGREPYEPTSGNYHSHEVLERGWFAEEICT